MRTSTPLSLLLLASLPLANLACQRPTLTGGPNQAAPAQLVLNLPQNSTEQDATTYNQALRERLQALVPLAEEGQATEAAPRFTVDLYNEGSSRSRAEGHAMEHGAALGTEVGTDMSRQGASTGDSVGTGVAAGVFTTLVYSIPVQIRASWRAHHLGFEPDYIYGRVTQYLGGRAVAQVEIPFSDVLSAMRPLKGADRKDPQAIRRDEAQAFADAIAARVKGARRS